MHKLFIRFQGESVENAWKHGFHTHTFFIQHCFSYVLLGKIKTISNRKEYLGLQSGVVHYQELFEIEKILQYAVIYLLGICIILVDRSLPIQYDHLELYLLFSFISTIIIAPILMIIGLIKVVRAFRKPDLVADTIYKNDVFWVDKVLSYRHFCRMRSLGVFWLVYCILPCFV